ncbi:uncharacterized protein [Rutidosis leptorrhynchoides]|uniref:uncharacterized protein n=1 Tax=Rutidosis leptorrhynchoides TaxID=125765 RepID=UPI003A99A559
MAMDYQRYNHRKNDHDSRYTTPDFKIELEIEKEAAELYTRTIFYDVQDEIYKSIMSCCSENVIQVYDNRKYLIRHIFDDNGNRKERSFYKPYEILFNKDSMKISCSCRRYECYGLLCCHIFYVLRMARVVEFPKTYVMKRWSKDSLAAKSDAQTSGKIPVIGGFVQASSVIREIYDSVEQCVNLLVGDLNKLSLYRDKQKEMLKQSDINVPTQNALNKNDLFASLLGVTEPAELNVKVPSGIRNKGCGNHKRIQSQAELAMLNAANGNRKCAWCGKREGHDKRNCPYRPKSSSAEDPSDAGATDPF